MQVTVALDQDDLGRKVLEFVGGLAWTTVAGEVTVTEKFIARDGRDIYLVLSNGQRLKASLVPLTPKEWNRVAPENKAG